jgi:hypothetical protein
VLLLSLMGCAWLEPTPDPLSTEGLDERTAAVIEALKVEIHDLQDRIVELEAAGCVKPADLPAELDAYVTDDELTEALSSHVSADELDEALEEVPDQAALDAVTADFLPRTELDERLADVPTTADLYDATSDNVRLAELDHRLKDYATLEAVDKRTEGFATRAWVRDEFMLPLDLLLYNAGIGRPDRVLVPRSR